MALPIIMARLFKRSFIKVELFRRMFRCKYGNP